MGQSGDPVNGGEKPLPHFLRIFPKSAWKIDFSSLKRDFQIHAQIWKDTKYEDIALAILGFVSSTYDIVSDSLLSKSYISGTDYVKIVDDYNDSVVTNCTFLGQNTYVDVVENKTEKFYEFSCFETDFYWGWITSSFVFLPGLLASPLLLYKLYRSGFIKQNKVVGSAMILAIILCIPIFPIFLLFVKVVSIIHHGKEWKKLKVILTYYEGQFESFLGFGLQTYIILERADRQPSMIQKVSIIASLLMMVVSEQNVHFSKTNSVPLQDDIKRRVKVLPLFLTGFIFVLGSAAVIATTDPFYLLYFIIAIIGILCCLYLCLTSLLIWKKYCPLKQATRRNQIQNLFHKIFRAATVRILVVIGEMIAMILIIIQSYVWPDSLPSDVLEKKYFKETSVGVLLCGIIFLILFYFQGKELWEVNSTDENQNGERKAINLELENREKGQEIDEENIVQLKDDEGKVFLVSQKYLEPLLQEK